ncbi:MAG: alpha/beta hydrolase [Hyphomicrobiaceae bacterium]|nr:alpha/beta hydrolase [Hyphomicrobiaceae bacterium]
MRIALIAACLLIGIPLGGCASGPQGGLLRPMKHPAGLMKTITILAATTRAPATPEEPGAIYNGERGDALTFAELEINIPLDREKGKLEIAEGEPDPRIHFALVASRPITLEQFKAALHDPSRYGGLPRRALVFTHGYNTKFDAAVFRFAQIAADMDFKGVPVLFSWPSRGIIRDYGYDRDSVAYSRDAQQFTMTTVAEDKAISGLDIFAHSMGNWLTMETLRQMSIQDEKVVRPKIGTVVMAAPDIDMDVFKTQTGRIGPLKSKLVIYASTDDRALALSQFLFGGKARVGNTGDLSEFKKLGIEAHDLSAVESGAFEKHGKAFGDPNTIASIGQMVADRTEDSPNLVHAVGGVLTLPVRMLGLSNQNSQ